MTGVLLYIYHNLLTVYLLKKYLFSKKVYTHVAHKLFTDRGLKQLNAKRP